MSCGKPHFLMSGPLVAPALDLLRYRLMSKQTDEEALFRRLDLSSLIPGGVPGQVLAYDPRYQAMQRRLERPAWPPAPGPHPSGRAFCSSKLHSSCVPLFHYLFFCNTLEKGR